MVEDAEDVMVDAVEGWGAEVGAAVVGGVVGGGFMRRGFGRGGRLVLWFLW